MNLYKIFISYFLLLFSNNIYSQYILINHIQIHGNNKTKPFIIERELTFKQGDTILTEKLRALLKKSEENLLKTSLFNFATIDTINSNHKTTDILIQVVERWYLWPIPIFEQASRNINTWIYDKEYDKINYGLFIAQANFRGRDELLRAIVRFGFREQYGFAYSIPHLIRNPYWGAEIKALYYRQKQVAYKTENNKPVYVYGKEYLYTNYEYSVLLSFRPKLYTWHQIELSFSNDKIHDSLFKLNPNFIFNNQKQIKYTSLLYSFTINKTNSPSYPLKGFFIETNLSYDGIGNNELSIPGIQAKTAYFNKIVNRLYHAHQLLYSYNDLKKPSYIFSKAFGYLTSPKGMELYLIDGKSYFLSTNSIHYQLVAPHVKNIYKLKNERFAKIHYAFYLSLNGDVGYVVNNYNEKHTNEWLYSYGLGLDLVTYYDIVFRTEFSINKFGNKGIFFHFSTFI